MDASLTIGDNEGFYPLDLCHLNNTRAVITDEELLRDPNEVYVWGSNENYNLGTGSEQPRLCPELLDKSKKLPWGNLGNWFIQVFVIESLATGSKTLTIAVLWFLGCNGAISYCIPSLVT